jgi:hypothetical protein
MNGIFKIGANELLSAMRYASLQKINFNKMIRAKYQDFPRKAKKAIKRNLMKTIHGNWKPKEVKIIEVSRVRYGQKPEYKSWTVCGYQLGSSLIWMSH